MHTLFGGRGMDWLGVLEGHAKLIARHLESGASVDPDFAESALCSDAHLLLSNEYGRFGLASSPVYASAVAMCRRRPGGHAARERVDVVS